ncbi:MAG TPA: S9 family peptidase [Streptosporangiaceae bacterium]|jgi:dipeptidyl aminopeptidase/acylaminoacyl peptidase
MTSFADLRDYVATPRLTGLRLAPDGSWLAAVIQGLSPDRKKYVSSIWRIDASPDGVGPVRLTRSAEGEASPEFLPDGSLLFISARPDPAGQPAAGRAAGPGDQAGPGSQPGGADAEAGDHRAALWLLPAGGGEPRRVAAPPGGVHGVAAARSAGTVAITAAVLPGSASLEQDARRRAARKDAGVSAILHDAGPVRYWDHDLGPDQLRLAAAELGAADAAAVTRDLTPDPGRALDEQDFELAPGGASVLTGWSTWDERGEQADELVAIDTATGQRRVLLAEAGYDFCAPSISPDGRLAVCTRQLHDSYDKPGDVTLMLVPLDGGGEPRDLLDGFDRRPAAAAWAPDGTAVYFTADDQGRCPVFRLELASGQVTRLTHDDGAYDSLCPAPGGRYLYAIRAAVTEPPTPVRLDLTADSGQPARLACPGTPLELPGQVAEIEATADDGATIRAWLVLPGGASAQAPAPLLLWAHGGPLSSWNSWSWRWNPWLMAAQGYAVLLPDPALSTGYGYDFIARGHGQWGGQPYRDLMAITDAAQARPDIDAARTGMMGGSFGGYMANWMAGHTDRFRAIVSHASLWSLEQMFGTTDLPTFWRRIYGDPAGQPERYLADSPHLHVRQISTPMLVIHGDKDYRVPVGEALRLWWDLQIEAKDARFLYFPDENHWILTPGNAIVWYQTVLAFLAQHVLGQPWQRPDML